VATSRGVATAASPLPSADVVPAAHSRKKGPPRRPSPSPATAREATSGASAGPREKMTP
jgi:hypothetical protein